MKGIESQLETKVLGCAFHFKKCIHQRRDEVGLRCKTVSDALVGTYFRRLGVLPFLPPYFLGILDCFPAPRLPNDRVTELLLEDFSMYFRNTWLPPNGTFHRYLDHSQNFGSRTTNAVEGSHTRLRAAFPNKQIPYLMGMLKYCRGEIKITKSLAASIANRTLVAWCIRPAEERRQQVVHAEIRDFQQ